MGYGIERCLYELNPELACLSPCLVHAEAVTPAEALLALEGVASQPNRPSFPVDRHLAAFLISRWKELSFVELRNLSKPQREVKNLAVLKILADIQVQFKVKSLPNLCQWLAHLCAPIATHYHNLKARARLQDELTKAVSTGQLTKLARVLENRQAVDEDNCDYQAAKIEVMLIESEIKEIKSRILNRNEDSLQNKGAWGKFYSFALQLLQAHRARKGKVRIAELYHKSENLREVWGEGHLPTRGSASSDFWKKLMSKMNVVKARRPVKNSNLRYD
jgi:hypothetical protein